MEQAWKGNILLTAHTPRLMSYNKAIWPHRTNGITGKLNIVGSTDNSRNRFGGAAK